MSQMFATLDVARSGMGVYKTWLNAVADNVANIDNITSTDQAAFRERFVLVQAVEDASGAGAGAEVAAALFGNPDGQVLYEPNHPLADENGMVRRPDINLGDQMVLVQLTQRGYQANIKTFERAREAYESRALDRPLIMSIAPIPPIASGFTLPGTNLAAPAAPAGGTSFGQSVMNALDDLSQSHAEVDGLAELAATGDLTAVHDFTIAASEAQLLTELTVQVRDRAIEAFNDIMRMQV